MKPVVHYMCIFTQRTVRRAVTAALPEHTHLLLSWLCNQTFIRENKKGGIQMWNVLYVYDFFVVEFNVFLDQYCTVVNKATFPIIA